MATLEDLQPGTRLAGIIPNQIVTVVSVQWHGQDAVTLFFTRVDGQPDTQLLYRADAAALRIIDATTANHFRADGRHFRLAAEAYRIRLAHLFDPLLAVHTSLVEPLPHQITAVYGEMLTRQPLRYLLADDPGAGKTIMAGLLIKELAIRGDVRRCLVCAPGNLTEQWQDELWEKFQLPFEILTRDGIEASRTGNPFSEHDFLIVRLDQLSRNDDLQQKIALVEWDLVVCDEAHKMSAAFFNGEVKETKRYQLGRLLSRLTRHLLLMTATPHNGREEDFQLFLALLDADRFEGRFREGVHQVDVSDLMRRMVKENLLKFDGCPLFPERRAHTVDYQLSEMETHLYEAVTEYVRQEFNRADQLQSDGRKGTVGFALTVLQRRLASSPEAIYQSLHRRRKRLEERLREAQHVGRVMTDPDEGRDEDFFAELDDAPVSEIEAFEATLADKATAAATVAELRMEIETLRHLEQLAAQLRHSGTDRKWQELSQLIQANAEMFSADGRRHKLVIFTEHRDTLAYLEDRISTLLGNADAIVTLHGGLNRERRKEVQNKFNHNPDVLILLATDAAGEGINLQRAHLMVNYDLPWNPNRLEQRFGRIHRIGQTEVCHLWNLVAGATREGHVYRQLLSKLEIERAALSGQVFDVLGSLFDQTPLRKLLIDAIRYGDQPEVRARLEQAIEGAVDREHIRELIEARSLAQQSMDLSAVLQVREQMERAAARRLQPHYIRSFFIEAFKQLGGNIYEREAGRYQITFVPPAIRERSRQLGAGRTVVQKYERVCFDKRLIAAPNGPFADFLSPGHPLLNATLDLTLTHFRSVLEIGAVLIDPADPSETPRVLFGLEQRIQDARPSKVGERRIISSEVHFVEAFKDGPIRSAGSAPYLDYRPPDDDELAHITDLLNETWASNDYLMERVRAFAIGNLIPPHLERVRRERDALITKTLDAVHERLVKEIMYWDRRAVDLRHKEQAGQINPRINAARAEQRAEDLRNRLKRRTEELEQELAISPAPPILVGRALIVPMGYLLRGQLPAEMIDRRIIEQIALRAVIQREIALGHSPRDVSAEKVGYDIESRDGQTGRLRFIEVKGRRAGADSIALTRHEILTALNTPDQFILAIVEVTGDAATRLHYVRRPFKKEPDFEVISTTYDLGALLANAESHPLP